MQLRIENRNHMRGRVVIIKEVVCCIEAVVQPRQVVDTSTQCANIDSVEELAK